LVLDFCTALFGKCNVSRKGKLKRKNFYPLPEQYTRLQGVNLPSLFLLNQIKLVSFSRLRLEEEAFFAKEA